MIPNSLFVIRDFLIPELQHPCWHFKFSGSRIDQTIPLIFNIGRLRINITRYWPLTQLLLEHPDQFSTFISIFRTSIIRETETAPLTDNYRQLSPEKKWIPNN